MADAPSITFDHIPHTAPVAAADRDAIADAAVADGRISPANHAVWRARLDENQEGTSALLATLTPSKAVPVTTVPKPLMVKWPSV